MHATTSRHWPAIGLGTLFAFGTAVVLLEDIVHGAPVTTAHMLTILAIVGTIAAGHLAWPYLQARQYLAGLGLGLLFLAGTFYLVVASGSRNAETQNHKVEQILQRNAERARLDAEVIAAKQRWSEAQAAFAAECGTGKGRRCEGREATANAFRDSWYMAAAMRDRAGAVERPLAGYAHSARVFAALTGGDEARIEKVLTLAMPFALVLITEFGCLVFWSIGLGKGRPVEIHWPEEPQKLLAVDVPLVLDERAAMKQAAVEWHKKFYDLNGRAPSWPEQREAFPDLSKTCAHRIRQEALA
jgi:hypothetical protein